MRVSELLTSEQVAERIGIKPALMRTWRKRGKGPKWSTIGRTVVYRESDVTRWENQQQEKSA